MAAGAACQRAMRSVLLSAPRGERNGFSNACARGPARAQGGAATAAMVEWICARIKLKGYKPSMWTEDHASAAAEFLGRSEARCVAPPRRAPARACP